MTTINLVRGDITTIVSDAIVNAANSSLMGGGGVDGAIHRVGGPEILEQCREIVATRGPVETGDAVITTAGLLPARYVIHAVGPVWNQLSDDSAVRLLASAYAKSLDLAAGNGCRTVAFPNVSTGVYGFPKELAAETAIDAVTDWAKANPNVIESATFVCFDAESHDIYATLLDG
jgi:O-acetyl-ADP-ribose deacetylase